VNNTITHPRSFGFQFRDSLLNGTLQNINGTNDIFFFFAGKEYENSAVFSKELNITNEESAILNEKINKIVNTK
jgi:hypothetical protein